jgi:hypothetical protein
VPQSETGSLSGGDRCWFGRRSSREKRRLTMNDTVIIIIMVKCTEAGLEDTQLKKPVTLLITDCTFLRPPFSDRLVSKDRMTQSDRYN